MDKKQQEELQQKYLELQLLGNQIKQLQKQMQATEEQIIELRTVAEGLSELNNAEKGSEMLAPISEGIFVKAALEDTKELIVNVGSDVCVKKTAQEVEDMLKVRLDNLKKHRKDLMGHLEKMAELAGALEEEFAKLAEKNV